MQRYMIQKESTGYSVWTVSPHTGSKQDCIAYCRTKREAQALIRKKYAKE